MSKRGSVLHRRAREIISNVDKYFEEEKKRAIMLLDQLKQARIVPGPDGNIHISRDLFESFIKHLETASKVTERVTLATGINKNTVSRIRREQRIATEASTSKITTPKKKPRQKKIVCDNFEICALGNIINSIYTVRKEIPTLKKIYAAAKQDLNFPGSLSTLRKIMIESLGYKFKNCQRKRSVLIQRPNIKAWRAKYLRRIRANDALESNKKPVVFLDETWIHAHYTVKKCWQSASAEGVKKNDSVGRRWIITHAGTEDGFIDGALLMFKAKQKSGDYHDEMNGENFIKWVNEKLIPNLPETSLVVMDNAPYHSMEETKAPNMSARKVQMQEWLTQNDIQYEQTFTKAELYELIKKNRPPKDYTIDNIFRSHGHEVLRLPPYNCDLNPIEYIWHLVKRRVADKNVEQLESAIERLTLESIASITKDDWKKEVNHVKRIEKDYFERELLEDDDNGPFSFIINIGDSSSSSSDDDDDYEESDSVGHQDMSGIEELSD